jgi:hypothetical protein
MDEIASPNELYLSCIEGFRVMNEVHHAWI